MVITSSQRQWSPAIVKAIEEDEKFKAQVKEIIDGILPMVEEAVQYNDQSHMLLEGRVNHNSAFSLSINILWCPFQGKNFNILP